MFEKEKKIKANIFMKTFSSENFLCFILIYWFSIRENLDHGQSLVSDKNWQLSLDNAVKVDRHPSKPPVWRESRCFHGLRASNWVSVNEIKTDHIGKRDEKKLLFVSRGGKWGCGRGSAWDKIDSGERNRDFFVIGDFYAWNELKRIFRRCEHQMIACLIHRRNSKCLHGDSTWWFV